MNERDRAVFSQAIQEALKRGKKGDFRWCHIDYTWEEGDERLPQDAMLAEMIKVAHKEATKLGGRIQAWVNNKDPEQTCISFRPMPLPKHSPQSKIIPGLGITKRDLLELKELVRRVVGLGKRGDESCLYFPLVRDQDGWMPSTEQVVQMAMLAIHQAKILGGELEIDLQAEEPDILYLGFRTKQSQDWKIKAALKEGELSIARTAGVLVFHRNIVGLVSLAILTQAIQAWARREIELGEESTRGDE